jgi:hypothetical protein
LGGEKEMRLLVFIVFLTGVCDSFALDELSPEWIAPSNPDGTAVVYYELIHRGAIIGEDYIAEEGCKYTIEMQDFLASLISKKPDRSLALKYRHDVTKAKIIFQDDEYLIPPIFVSGQGMVRHRDDFYRINLDKFRKSFSKFLGCPRMEYDDLLKITLHQPRKMIISISGVLDRDVTIDGDYFIRQRKYTSNGQITTVDMKSFGAINVYGNSIVFSENGIAINGQDVIDSIYVTVERDKVLYDSYLVAMDCDTKKSPCHVETEDFDYLP